MNEDAKRAKLTQFATDKLMVQAVKSVFESIFRKQSPDRDVNNLASRFLSLELSDKVWNEIESYRLDNKKKEKSTGNVGL